MTPEEKAELAGLLEEKAFRSTPLMTFSEDEECGLFLIKINYDALSLSVERAERHNIESSKLVPWTPGE